jgi:hypothetical protein
MQNIFFLSLGDVIIDMVTVHQPENMWRQLAFVAE